MNLTYDYFFDFILITLQMFVLETSVLRNYRYDGSKTWRRGMTIAFPLDISAWSKQDLIYIIQNVCNEDKSIKMQFKYAMK